jgi:hypothetical protein
MLNVKALGALIAQMQLAHGTAVAPVTINATFLGDPTPQAERWIARASRAADGRSIPITRNRR